MLVGRLLSLLDAVCTCWLAGYCHHLMLCVHVGWQAIVTVQHGVCVLVGRLLSLFDMVCTCWFSGYCHYLMLCVRVGWPAIVTT